MNDKTRLENIFDYFKINRILAPVFAVVIVLTILDNTTNTFLSLKNKFYTFTDSVQKYDESKSESLYIKIYIMKNPKKMKIELDKYLKKHPSFVMPYMLFYDFYMKINDLDAAVLILKKATKIAKPKTVKDYYELVSKLYNNQLEPKLQKKYIKEAYLKKNDDFQYKQKIQDLYDKITKQSSQ
jgi:hypothetical protein